MILTLKPLVVALVTAFAITLCQPLSSRAEFAPASESQPESVVPHPEARHHAEQLALTRYLAAKYKQSVNAVHRIVLAAYREAPKAGLSPLLILALAEKESSLKAGIVNAYGAVGLLQVVPKSHPKKLATLSNPAELHEPEVNIRVGSAILAEYVQSNRGNVDAALVQYSGGATNFVRLVAKFQDKLEQVKASATFTSEPDA